MDANKFIYFDTHRTDRFIVRLFSLGFCAHFYSFGGYILLCRSFFGKRIILFLVCGFNWRFCKHTHNHGYTQE